MLHTMTHCVVPLGENLHKLYILLGCAVRLKVQPSGDIDLALRQFGFKLQPKAIAPGQ